MDECSKVRMIFNKDIAEFQFVEALREVCTRCTEVRDFHMRVDTPEKM